MALNKNKQLNPIKKEQNTIKLMSYLILVLCLCVNNTLFSQEFPQYTQYTYNMNIVNPAYAGLREGLSVGILGRSQWIGVEGAPKTGTLSIHSAVGRQKNVGLGFSAIYDQLGPLKETHLYADVSYKIAVSYEGTLSLGIKGGISFQSIDESLLDFNLPQNIENDLGTKKYPNLGFGMFYSEEKFYLSISMPNVLGTNFFEIGEDSKEISAISKNSTFFIGSGYVFNLSKEVILKPALMLKYSSVYPFSFDLSATAFIDEKIELGISYRIKESVAFITALNVNENLRIGYAYDYPIGSFSKGNKGSHEIMLLFDVLTERNMQNKSPRWY